MGKYKKLKSGFTTGTASAAAAKGALQYLITGNKPAGVSVSLLTGDIIDIKIHTLTLKEENTAICTVIKHAGDDPDITNGAEIGAKVTLINDNPFGEIEITGGKGVGTVTKPGLEVLPGNAAINSGPKRMIKSAIEELLSKHTPKPSVKVEVFVPEGEILAKKTLNSRLGIIGGISILGTTGIVRPMSHEAYIATIESSLSVAHAVGIKSIVLTTGRRSERFARLLFKEFPEESFIQIGDYFESSLLQASKTGFQNIILAVFFGKAVKMAQGASHTHAAKSTLDLKNLSNLAFEATGNLEISEKILSSNTARHALDFILPSYPEIISRVGRLMIESATKFAGIPVNGVIFNYSGNIIFNESVKSLICSFRQI